jgi:tRNA dimethylallyltransferase
MDLSLPTIHVVAGPTGAGKTAAAIKLAHELNGELINADSRQIYKYLDIGTNKGSLELIQDGEYPLHRYPDGPIIHLVGFLNPDQVFSVHQYQALALATIDQILSKGKTPILVGGTGLYIQSVIDPSYKFVELNEDLSRIKQELTNLSTPELQARVQAALPPAWQKLNHSDRNNPRRLVNLLIKVDQASAPTTTPTPKYNVIKHYIDLDSVALKQRLQQRAEEMWDAGMPDEVRRVLAMGYQPHCPGLSSLGYQHIIDYLNVKIPFSEAIDRITTSHWQYARKQRTWFKKYFVNK